MELKINSWKTNTPPNVNHRIIKDYIQDTAAKYNIPDYTLYNTRVDRASKIQNIWQVQTTTLTGRGSEAKKESKHWVWLRSAAQLGSTDTK
jgi:cation diffusion facilitator CzcD-associated flavoprotein CzcO